jgi:transcriptional regulator with XRE-family HTH domain
MMDRPERIAWHVRRAREQAGLSVEDAADAAGISVDELAATEAGWRAVDQHEMERLARAYGMTPDALVPPRTPVVVDPDSRTLGIGERRPP